MPRIARVVCSGVPDHVTQRGNRRGPVFFTDEDRRIYLHLLHEYMCKHAVEILAYCLMTNHVHLVVVPGTGHGLHRALKPLHMRHAQRINRAHGWNGHLWQGRYFSSALDETYTWAAIRYVEQNPVRAKMVGKAEDYPWSSAAAHCGLHADPVLTTNTSWQQLYRAIADCSAWLVADDGDEEQRIDVLRRHSDKGLPCGSLAFLERIEKSTGRALYFRPRGRPKESSANKG